MRVGKAKRRYMRWVRYVQQTGTHCNHKNFYGIHSGHINSHSAASEAHTWAPRGIRSIPFIEWQKK